MKLGHRGDRLIKSYETLRLVAFKPTPDDVWTIGWGHTKGVKEGDVCTAEQADAWFLEDVAVAEEAINRLGYRLPQAMFDALTSLAYNCGVGAVAAEFASGDVLHVSDWLAWLNLYGPDERNSGGGQESTVGNALAEARYYAAWRGFALWTKQAGKDLLGLARRRAEEMALFLEDGFPK